MPRSFWFSRLHLVASLLAAPAVISALAIGASHARDLVRPEPSRYSDPVGEFADAITKGGVEDAYAFVRAGTDPNTPIAFRDPGLTGGRQIMISPLLLAVAAHNENVVMMLLSFGARMDLPANARAACLANRLGDRTIAEMIVRDARPAPDVTCPDVTPDPAAPLLAFVQ